MDHHHVWRTGDRRDGRDIADKIEIELFVERRIDRVCRSDQEERVARRSTIQRKRNRRATHALAGKPEPQAIRGLWFSSVKIEFWRLEVMVANPQRQLFERVVRMRRTVGETFHASPDTETCRYPSSAQARHWVSMHRGRFQIPPDTVTLHVLGASDGSLRRDRSRLWS